jgi:hypothetical protein
MAELTEWSPEEGDEEVRRAGAEALVRLKANRNHEDWVALVLVWVADAQAAARAAGVGLATWKGSEPIARAATRRFRAWEESQPTYDEKARLTDKELGAIRDFARCQDKIGLAVLLALELVR